MKIMFSKVAEYSYIHIKKMDSSLLLPFDCSFYLDSQKVMFYHLASKARDMCPGRDIDDASLCRD
jgi:hypothetical protein